MRGTMIGYSHRRAAGVLALAILLVGCSPNAVSTQVSNVTGTGVTVATQVGPTAAAAATTAAGISGTALPGAQQTAVAIATNAPGVVGSAVAGAPPTIAAIATNAGGAFATAGAIATTLPGNAPLRVGQFAAKTGSGTGSVQVVATPGGTGVVRFNQDFSVTGGTKRSVYLTKESSPSTRAEVERGFVDLGPLRSASGQDVYPVPSGTDINSFTGVVIYDTEAQAPLLAAPLARP